MHIFFAGLFLVAFPVACGAAPGGSLPAVPAEFFKGKYQLEKRQGKIFKMDSVVLGQ